MDIVLVRVITEGESEEMIVENTEGRTWSCLMWQKVFFACEFAIVGSISISKLHMCILCAFYFCLDLIDFLNKYFRFLDRNLLRFLKNLLMLKYVYMRSYWICFDVKFFNIKFYNFL